MKRLLVLLLLMPVAYAAWYVEVSGSIFGVNVLVVADANGCIEFFQPPQEVYLLTSRGFEAVGGVEYQLCASPGDVIELQTAYDFGMKLPESVVYTEVLPPLSVRVVRIGESIVLEGELNVLWFLLIPLFLMVVYVLRGRMRGTGDDPIIEIVAQNPGITQKELAKKLGWSKYKVSRALSRLEQEGKIVRIRKGISKRVYLKSQL